MDAAEIRESRRELRRFEKEFRKVANFAKRGGKKAAQSFGGAFKEVATESAKAAARGFFEKAGGALFDKLASRKGKTGGKRFAKSFKQAAKAEASSGGGIASMFKGPLAIGSLGIIGAGALAASAAGQFKGAMQQAIEQEQLTVSFDALSADGAGGARIFEILREEAMRTGADIGDMADNVRKMMANGMEETAAIKLNQSLLDIGGATGLASYEIGLLGNALAQVAGKGVAQMEELRGQIGEKGVPVFEALRQAMDLPDLNSLFSEISAGNVSAEQLLNTFQNMEGPFAKFKGGADRLGGTLGGLLARLKQERMDMQRQFGAALAPELKPFIEDLIGKVRAMKDEAAGFGTVLGNAIGGARAFVSALSFGEMFQVAALTLKAGLMNALNTGAKAISAMMSLFKDDSFGSMMQRAAIQFRKTMLAGLADIFDAFSGSKIIGKQASAARDALQGKADAIQFDPKENGKNLAEAFVEKFQNTEDMFALNDEDMNALKDLTQKIADRRAQDLAERNKEPEKPQVDSSSGGSGGGESKGYEGGVVAGGIANDISKLLGGPSTILMTKQLDVQKGIREGVEKNAESSKRTAKAMEKLVRQQKQPTANPAVVL